MSVFADTSGLYALLIGSEDGHADIVGAFRNVLTGDRPLRTTSYVLIETMPRGVEAMCRIAVVSLDM